MGRSSPEAIKLRKILDDLDMVIEYLRHPNRVPPATIPRLVKELNQALDNFDRSKLDENMQLKLLKKTDWYKTQLSKFWRRHPNI